MTLTVPFYTNALSFATNLLCSNRASANVDKYDIVHNVITKTGLSEYNWKSMIYEEVKSSLASKPIVPFEELSKLQKENMRVCKKCGESHYSDVFKAGFNTKTQLQQYRSTCITCHNEIRKSYKKKILTEEQKEKSRLRSKERRALEIALYGKVQDPTAKERYERYKFNKKISKQNIELI